MEQKSLEQRLRKPWPPLSQLATTAQLADAGLGERVLASALKRGLIFRLRKGVYVQAAQWLRCKPWEQEKLRLFAHVLTVRGEPVYSFFSAARLHGLFIWNCSALVHVTTSSTNSSSSGARDVNPHHETLDASEIEELKLTNGMPLTATTLERTVVDCARMGGFAEAVVIGDHALYKDARIEIMWSIVNAMPQRRGVRRARRVLHALDGKSESPGESRTRLSQAAMKIDQPELQKELIAGDRMYRPDFVWEEQMLIVEFDGDSKYFACERTDKIILEERKREKRLMEMGWRFVRLEWKDLANPEDVKRRVVAAYNAPFLVSAA